MKHESVLIRITPDMLNRIDQVQHIMQLDYPECVIRITRTDAIRQLISIGLDKYNIRLEEV
jgi:hypothetical protein